METLALIPARGGSKSIPRKNLMQVAGRPLLSYSIETAAACPSITRIIVSTDDAEIAQVARAWGAEIIMRPPEFATDESPDIDAFAHALHELWDNEGYVPQLVVHLRPTYPVRTVARVEEAIALLRNNPRADSVRSVSLAKQTPYKMWRIGAGELVPIIEPTPHKVGIAAEANRGTHYFKEHYSMPRQTLPPVYHQNGYVDVIRAKTIMAGYMAGDVILPLVIDEAIPDLDYIEDVAKIEAALRATYPERAERMYRYAV